VKFVKLAPAVLALTMLSQHLVVAQDPAQPSTPAKPPNATTERTGQAIGAAPPSQSKGELAENQSSESQPMDSMPRKYVEMWNTGDLHPIATMFTYPVFITFHGQKKFLDTGTLAKVIMSWRKSMPDLNFKIEDTIVQGDRVAMRLTFTGSAEIWDDYDELAMRLQMGAVWRSNQELGACSCKPDAASTSVPSPAPQP
jgi:hypothetical protein